MQAALESVDGVKDVFVDYGAKTATVTASAGTDPAALIQALEAADFGGTVQ